MKDYTIELYRTVTKIVTITVSADDLEEAKENISSIADDFKPYDFDKMYVKDEYRLIGVYNE